MISGFNTVYRNPHPNTLLFKNFFLHVGEGAPAVTSGPLSAIVYVSHPMAKTSSYATGLQLNFPE